MLGVQYNTAVTLTCTSEIPPNPRIVIPNNQIRRRRRRGRGVRRTGGGALMFEKGSKVVKVDDIIDFDGPSIDLQRMQARPRLS
jgi:hypothetical protein